MPRAATMCRPPLRDPFPAPSVSPAAPSSPADATEGGVAGVAPPDALRRLVRDGLKRIAECPADDRCGALAELCAPDLAWRGSHPINEHTGLEAVADAVWAPLKRALPDLERRDDILVAGTFEGRDYVATIGHYCGTFEHPWLGIPPTGDPLFLRYGEVHRIENGLILQSSCLWDVVDAMRQAGFFPLAPSLGLEGRWPGPLTADGVRLEASDARIGEASLAQTLAMHDALGAHDDRADPSRRALLDMPQKEHWHPKMMWYGPSGIGTARALAGFVDRHQLPFRLAFPGRKGGGQWADLGDRAAEMGGGHYIRIGDGPYSVTSGWPSVFATHEGGSIFGVPATGREVTMRVMDFYLHDEGLIRENWVPLDVLDVLLQMGVDVMGRMQGPFARASRR